MKKAVFVDSMGTQVCVDLANFDRLQNRVTDAQQALQDGISKNPAGTASMSIGPRSIGRRCESVKASKAEVLLDKRCKQPGRACGVNHDWRSPKLTNLRVLRGNTETQITGNLCGHHSLLVRMAVVIAALRFGVLHLIQDHSQEVLLPKF